MTGKALVSTVSLLTLKAAPGWLKGPLLLMSLRTFSWKRLVSVEMTVLPKRMNNAVVHHDSSRRARGPVEDCSMSPSITRSFRLQPDSRMLPAVLRGCNFIGLHYLSGLLQMQGLWVWQGIF